jgi:3-oxoacyl-[acyl-carrier protein] reductase
LFTARSFLRELAATGARSDGAGASIVFIGSTAGRFGEAEHAEYAASKAGLIGLMRSLKNEIVALDPGGRVNVVEPGWTVTDLTRATLDAKVIARVTATMPLAQLARPEDVAAAVVALASPALSRHVSGQIVTVAGGMEGRLLRDPKA